MQIYEFSHTIHDFVLQKNFNEALAFFKHNKTSVNQKEIKDNEYLIADMLTSLRGIKAFEAAYQFLHIYNITIEASTPLRILNSYGWLLYAALKDSYTDMDKSQLSKLAHERRLLELMQILHVKVQQEAHGATIKHTVNLIGYLFILISQHVKAENKPNYSFLKELYECINPENLSDSSFKIHITNSTHKHEKELASPREEWYAQYSKTLFELSSYEACIAVCTEALNKVKNMHYHNNIWFFRRIAQCYYRQKIYDKAIETYEMITSEKHDWFLFHELAECYFNKGNNHKALEMAKKAASSAGPINFKVELIALLGDILYCSEEYDLALKHYLLVRAIREAENWKENTVLTQKIEKLNAGKWKTDFKKETLKNELTFYWNGNKINKPLNRDIKKGTIVKLLAAKEHGTDGFINIDDGVTIYFFLPHHHPGYQQLNIGQKVTFQTTDTPKGIKAKKLKFVE